MASGRHTEDALVRSYAAGLRTTAASLSEARVCQIIQNCVDIGHFFVRAFEGGRVDCGLYLGSKLLTGSSVNRIRIISESEDKKNSILAFDVKSISPFFSEDLCTGNLNSLQSKRIPAKPSSLPPPEISTLLPYFHCITSAIRYKRYRPSDMYVANRYRLVGFCSSYLGFLQNGRHLYYL